MLHRLAQRLSSARVPQTRRLVERGSEQGITARAERDRTDAARVMQVGRNEAARPVSNSRSKLWPKQNRSKDQCAATVRPINFWPSSKVSDNGES
jgi:hypothetical protein